MVHPPRDDARATPPRDALARNSAPLATPIRRVAPKAALAASLKEVATGKSARSRRSPWIKARKEKGSASAEPHTATPSRRPRARLTLSDAAGLRADPRLRRLRALLPRATHQVAPQGAPGANAPPASPPMPPKGLG